MKKRVSLPVAVLLLGIAVGRAAAQDPLTAARDLYAAANYEDALSVLNRMRVEPGRPEDRPRIEQYRAFCLLALGRGADAAQAIEALVAADPSFVPSASDVSPRVRSAFSDVRRRVLPALVQQRYAEAKQAYDRKGYAEAAEGFRRVLETLADPDVAPVASQPPYSDIKTLAGGFLELAVTAALPPPPPPAPVAVEPPAPAAPPAAPAVPAAPRIYTASDGDVVGPVVVRRDLPAFPKVTTGQLTPAGGVLEIVVSESGAVEAAAMRTPISPVYDKMVVNAARAWQFEPATRQGQPVKYRKLVQITIAR